MRIHAIQTGSVAVKARQREGVGRGNRRFLNMLLDSEWTEPLPIYCWLIEHPEGLVLVDTGETARAAGAGYFPSWHPYYRRGLREWVQEKEEVGPQLRRLGVSPSDVTSVVLTHLHTDHAGGLERFPTSQIFVARAEAEAAAGVMGRMRGYLNNRWPRWFSPTLVGFDHAPLGPFPHTAPLMDDGSIVLVSTPGHSPGHLSVVVETEGEAFFLAGDASYTEALMRSGSVDGVSRDERAARTTLRQINDYLDDTGAIYLPSHDPDSSARLAAAQPALDVRRGNAARVAR